MKRAPQRGAATAWLAMGTALLCGTGGLAGCGKSAPPPADVAARAAVAAAGDTDRPATAAEVAKRLRGNPRCPAELTTPPRAAGAPVDDVLGVRPGMGYDEAWNAVLCAGELLVAVPESGRGFTIKTYGQTLRQGFDVREAEPHVVRTGRQIVQDMQRESSARGANAVREDMKPGQSHWFVGTMGLPGQERVLSVAREERFASEQAPTVDSVHAALLQKYGPPTRDKPAADGQLAALRWAYDVAGRPLAEGVPLASQCVGRADPNQGMNLRADCGLVVEALLITQRANPALVDRLQVGIVQQAAGHRLLTATEQGLAELDRQRRDQEVEKADKGSKAPSL